MNGQWIGEYAGTNHGVIFINVDEVQDKYEITAYLNDYSAKLPGSGVIFSTPNKAPSFNIRESVIPVNPLTGIFDEWKNVRGFYPQDVRVPSYADISLSYDGNRLQVSWITDIGTSGSCILEKSDVEGDSELKAEDKTWNEFKEYVSTLESKNFIYRGQKKPWKLSTSYHRSGRANLARYLSFDIPVLHRYLSSQTKHFFNLNNGDENGAFYNLAQHHGYPTPLLDWTSSPYVAAYFAYKEISKTKSQKATPSEKVRIFLFDRDSWIQDFPQLSQLLLASPHFSIRDFLAIENNRMIPQQAVSSLTNLVDIEAYIRSQESIKQKQYLWVIDMPVSERIKVMKELEYMGITAGALFPGLDGTCEELKERHFDI